MIEHIRDMLRMLTALRAFLRLHYPQAALHHIGHTHPDATELARKIIGDQLVVDDFLDRP